MSIRFLQYVLAANNAKLTEEDSCDGEHKDGEAEKNHRQVVTSHSALASAEKDICE